MSLVITSSSQTEYDTTSVAAGGIESPSSFKNFLNSPLTLDADTEVAVVSVKCNRDRNTITIQKDEGFYLYWGAVEPENNNDLADINTALQLVVTPGTYTPELLAKEVKRVIDKVVLKAYGEVETVTVSAVYTADLLTGYSLQFVQRGHGNAFTDKPAAASWGPYINASTLESYEDPTLTTSSKSRNVVITDKGANVTITGYNASYPTEVCDCIGRSNPLSQVDSRAVFEFNGSSASGGDPDGYTIGLTRSLGSKDRTAINQDYVLPIHQILPSDGVNTPAGYGLAPNEVPFLWDVAFNWAPGQDGQVVQLTAETDNISSFMTMKPITTIFTPTNASLQAKYWESVIFDVEGEKMTISLKRTGNASEDKLVDGASTTFDERVKPLGITCNQLYPKVAIHQNDAAKPGVVTFTTWNGIPGTRYYDENYWGYGRLDGNRYQPSQMFMELYRNIDISDIYTDGTAPVTGGIYIYKGVISGNKGIANSWTLLMGESLMYSNGQEALLLNNLDRFRSILGVTRDETPESSASGAGSEDVTFTSTDPETTDPTKSMFIRLKNMSINSYNANMRSISNIIYSCPRFDTRGNQSGNLFFEPSERVYVSLNNPNKTVLNSMEIDLVGVNEEVLNDFVGNTIVVLHFRKRR